MTEGPRSVIGGEKWFAIAEERQREIAERLHGGGGGGTSGGMETRLARLEKQTDSLVDKVGDLRVDVGKVEVKVDHLPSKGFIVTATSATIVLMTAAIVFGDKLQALIGR